MGPERWRPNEKCCRVRGTDRAWKDGGRVLEGPVVPNVEKETGASSGDGMWEHSAV